jgi:hypothetical protein
MSEQAAPSVGFVDQSGGKATYEIDFSALREKAAEMLDQAEASPAAPVAPAVPPAVDPNVTRVKGSTEPPKADGQGPAPVVAEAAPEPVVETPAEVKLAELSDDSLVKVIVDGEEVVMPWKDAKSGISRQQKFTKSMQQLARDRETVTAQQARTQQLETERQGLENFLKNPNAVLNYVAQTFGPQALQALIGQPQPQAVAGRNPDEIVTAGEAQQIAVAERQAVERQIQGLQRSIEDRAVQVKAEIAHEQQKAQHAVKISSTLNEIFTENPVLKSIPNVEDLIRFEVSQLKPQTETEALDAFKQVSKGMVEEISRHFKAQQKITKVAEVKAKLESKSIEPPGGSAPQIQPTNFKDSDGSVNWNKVKEMALNYGG